MKDNIEAIRVMEVIKPMGFAFCGINSGIKNIPVSSF